MTAKLYANIGVGHENDVVILESRIISAAHCNADAVVLTKSTPALVIPDNKKYVRIDSKWGSRSYLEVAKLSELSISNTEYVDDLCGKIGIPLIWSVTDQESLMFVVEHTNCETIKIHYSAVDVHNLLLAARDRFEKIIVCNNHLEQANVVLKNKNKFVVSYTTPEFPPEVENLQLHNIDDLQKLNYRVAYEGRAPGIFPCMAVSYKGVEHIEKYLGDENSDMPAILTPAQFYDLFNSMKLMTDANGDA